MSRANKSVRHFHIHEVSIDDLRNRLHRYLEMERAVRANKARRSWKTLATQIENELESRLKSTQ